MAEEVSSADPQRLYSYAVNAQEINGRLVDGANRLEGLLYQFANTCTEPGLAVPHVLYLLDELRALARFGEECDRWVEEVSRRFEQANVLMPLSPVTASEGGIHSTLPAANQLPVESSGDTPPVHYGAATAVEQPHPAQQPPPAAVEPMVAVAHVATPIHPHASPPAGTALLQTHPQGDDAVLNLRRLMTDQSVETGAISHRPLETVGDHIREYGCLMTSHTMLLQDAGVDVSVTDLYKANFLVKTGQNFDQMAAGGSITLSDLYAHQEMISQASHGQFHAMSATLGDNLTADIGRMVQAHGPLVVHVNNHGADHWVVVDGVNTDGTINVRDPLAGQRHGVSLSTDGGADYQLHLSRNFQYLVRG
jgi:hypothetical protein